jgi:hypothetical protein
VVELAFLDVTILIVLDERYHLLHFGFHLNLHTPPAQRNHKEKNLVP